MLQKGDTLDSLLKENFSKMIYGEKPIDDFEALVDQWKASGGDDMTAEVNEWFKSVQENKE
jgi:putative aldouronate transport system substrate-binding protein